MVALGTNHQDCQNIREKTVFDVRKWEIVFFLANILEMLVICKRSHINKTIGSAILLHRYR